MPPGRKAAHDIGTAVAGLLGRHTFPSDIPPGQRSETLLVDRCRTISSDSAGGITGPSRAGFFVGVAPLGEAERQLDHEAAGLRRSTEQLIRHPHSLARKDLMLRLCEAGPHSRWFCVLASAAAIAVMGCGQPKTQPASTSQRRGRYWGETTNYESAPLTPEPASPPMR
jgi:hypothetical protein